MRRAIAITVTALLLGACDEKKAAPVVKTQAAVGSGVVRGVVRFVGTPPVMPEIVNQPCHEGAGKIHEETVIVGSENGMANVIVYLKDGPPGDGSSRPPAVLDQKDCHYVPHVVAIQNGQPLSIRSSDPTIHNVHYISDHNGSGNFAQTQVGAEKTLTLDTPEIAVRVKCDVHPWMTGYIGVMPGPCFAVTREDGKFEITGIPSGTYTLAAWQEKYGTIEQKITVTDQTPVEQDLQYKAP